MRARPRHAALLALALLAGSCGHGPEESRDLPPGGEQPAFLVQSYDRYGTLLLGGRDAVWRSSDAGRTWQPVADRDGRESAALALPSDASLLAEDGTLRRGTLSLDRLGPARPAPFAGGDVIALGSARGAPLYALVAGAGAGSASRLWRSDDAGRTWRATVALRLPGTARALAVAREGDGHALYAAAGPAGLWRSGDGGESFAPTDAKGDVTAVAAAEAAGGRLLIATPGVQVSDDGGLSWRASPLEAVDVAGGARNADLWFAVDLDGALRVSTDGARSWSAAPA